MKQNIFLYPTNEPSQLFSIIGRNTLGKTTNDPFFTENMGGGTQNQYVVVISNDPIKKGDWVLMFDSFGNLFLGHEPQQYLGIEHGHHLNDGLRKIIFSNDPKLIETGVQPINEDFLEWLVDNPTLRFIETTSNFNRGNGKTYYKLNVSSSTNDLFKQHLAKYGYNLGNSVPVEVLIDEIFPDWLEKNK